VFEVENMLSNSWSISIAVLIVRKFDSDGIIIGSLFNCVRNKKEVRRGKKRRRE
jgi:hypothetical protein